MFSEVDIAGIYLPPIVVYGLVALVILMIVRSSLGRRGLLRWVWHPALVEVALYISILSVLVLLF